MRGTPHGRGLLVKASAGGNDGLILLVCLPETQPFARSVVFKLAVGAVLVTAFAIGIPAAAPDRALAAEPEQTVPQGEDPPGADEGGADVPPPSEHKGIIPPPAIGDEGIHKDVPDPNAGTDEEVIPPSALPEQDPDPDSE